MAIEDAVPECAIQRNNSMVLHDRRKPTTSSIVLIIITGTILCPTDLQVLQ